MTKMKKKPCVFNICAWSLFNKALSFCSLRTAEFVGNSFPPLLVIFWWSSRPDIYQALFHPWILQFSRRLFWTLMLIEKCCFRIDVKEKNLRQFGVILSIFKALQLIRRSVKFSMQVHLVIISEGSPQTDLKRIQEMFESGFPNSWSFLHKSQIDLSRPSTKVKLIDFCWKVT